jgi:uracil-DNA glycosylase family 4
VSAAELDALAEEIRAHRGCGFEPCETCTHPVPGEGAPDADVMLVGEAPGAKEDELGRPFVGGAGRLLEKLLGEAGLAREQVFITNVLKARPPGNRDPRAAEVAHSLPWLEEQLRLVAPLLVVTLGRHALDVLAPGHKITQAHGAPIEAGGRTVFPCHHPAAALRVQPLRATLREDFTRIPGVLAGLRGRA